MGSIAQTDDRAADRVFFDGGCPVCRREIAWYTKRPGGDGLAWVDVTDADNQHMYPEGFDQAALLKRFTVVRRDGQVVIGAAAFVAIWRAIDGLARWGRFLDHRPIVWVGQRIYVGFLVVRRLWRKAS